MKIYKRIICVISLIALCLCVFPLSGHVAAASTHKVGAVTWTIENGRATISGHGKMADRARPWSINPEDITEVVIESGITQIGEGVFQDFPNLTTVIICEGVTDIGKAAFLNCTRLSTITLPASLKTIGVSAFYDCFALKTVHISDIGAWCNIDFQDYDANPLSCGADLYMDNQLVTDLVIPEGCKRVSDFAFYGYIKLKTVYFPDGFEEIRFRAFSNCVNLKHINLPASTQFIGYAAFSQCRNLRFATFRGRLGQLRKLQIDNNNETLEQISWQQSTGYAMLTSLVTGLISVGVQAGIVFLILHIRRKRRGY